MYGRFGINVDGNHLIQKYLHSEMRLAPTFFCHNNRNAMF